MGSRYEHVFAPLRIRGVDFKNRLELAPPSPNLADRRDGRVTTEFVDFFRVVRQRRGGRPHVGNSVVDIKEASDEERQLDLGTDECLLPLTLFAEMCARLRRARLSRDQSQRQGLRPRQDGQSGLQPLVDHPVPRAVAREAAGPGDARPPSRWITPRSGRPSRSTPLPPTAASGPA